VWCDPEYKKKTRATYAAKRRRDAAALRALKDQERRAERDALASTTSPDLSKSYALVRKLALALDAASNSSSTQQSTDVHLRTAVTRCFHCEDAITQAMKSERGDRDE